MHIYVAKDGKQAGPFSDEQIRSMLDGGLISAEDLGWREGITDWQPLRILIGIAQPPPLPLQEKTPEQPCRGTKRKEPHGIGGWLLFFCISLTILGPLVGAYQINENWMNGQPAFQVLPTVKSAILFENWGSVALVLYGFIVGCLIWNGVPYGKRLAQQFLIVRFLALIFLELLTLMFMSDLPQTAINETIPGMIREFSEAFVFSLVWWLYFKRSRRVKNTYDAYRPPAAGLVE